MRLLTSTLLFGYIYNACRSLTLFLCQSFDLINPLTLLLRLAGSCKSWSIHSCEPWHWEIWQRLDWNLGLLISLIFFLFVFLLLLLNTQLTFASSGYFEDRRPASNMDPYVVTSMIAETTLLWKPQWVEGSAAWSFCLLFLPICDSVWLSMCVVLHGNFRFFASVLLWIIGRKIWIEISTWFIFLSLALCSSCSSNKKFTKNKECVTFIYC